VKLLFLIWPQGGAWRLPRTLLSRCAVALRTIVLFCSSSFLLLGCCCCPSSLLLSRGWSVLHHCWPPVLHWENWRILVCKGVSIGIPWRQTIVVGGWHIATQHTVELNVVGCGHCPYVPTKFQVKCRHDSAGLLSLIGHFEDCLIRQWRAFLHDLFILLRSGNASSSGKNETMAILFA